MRMLAAHVVRLFCRLWSFLPLFRITGVPVEVHTTWLVFPCGVMLADLEALPLGAAEVWVAATGPLASLLLSAIAWLAEQALGAPVTSPTLLGRPGPKREKPSAGTGCGGDTQRFEIVSPFLVFEGENTVLPGGTNLYGSGLDVSVICRVVKDPPLSVGLRSHESGTDCVPSKLSATLTTANA